MTVNEAAKQLGLVMAKEACVTELNAAKAAYDADPEIQTLLSEYRAGRALLSELYAKSLNDEENAVADKTNARVIEVGELIRANPTYQALEAAQEKVNAMMGEINAAIGFYAFGETPSCTHDCASCSGCSHPDEE